MAEMGTGTATETPEVVPAAEVETPEAETPAADTETADTETGNEPGEEKTPEQIEIDERAAAIAKSKAGTDPVIQKRIDKITRQAKQDAEIAYLRGKLEAVEQYGLKPQAPTAAAPEVETPPNPDDFATTAEFVKAVTDFSVKQAFRQAETAQHRRSQEAEQVRTAQAQAEVRNRVIDEGVKEFGEDFEDDVINNPKLKISPVMAAAIYESKAGHVLAKTLSDNPEEAARIAGLTPVAQIKEMVSLETKIMAARQPKTTQTPAPIRPLNGGAQPDVDESKMSDKDAIALERKRLAEKRKGW